MCAGVLSVHMSVKMATLHGCCLSWSPVRLYGKTDRVYPRHVQNGVGDYSKEEPGQHSDTAGSAVCTTPAPGSHLGNPPQSMRKPQG